MYLPGKNELFHVHTYRCGHAGSELDEAYVVKAIECGFDRIVFTDHAPFPDDPFGSRMKMEEYSEYIDSIYSLKEKYRNSIEVLCGIEIEYFPQYIDYYKGLRQSRELDVIMLGQHMYKNEDGTYNFMDKDRTNEFRGISKAMVDGLNTGLFDVLAHPDRLYMRHPIVDTKVQAAIDSVVKAARDNGVLLEKNYGSMYKEHNFGEEFWANVKENEIIYGYDAHSIVEIDNILKNIS